MFNLVTQHVTLTTIQLITTVISLLHYLSQSKNRYLICILTTRYKMIQDIVTL